MKALSSMKRVWRHGGAVSTGVAIGLVLLLVTWLAYIDGGSRSSYVHFYYIPIVAASYVLGDLGGIVTAFAAALLAALLPTFLGTREPPQDMIVRGLLFYFIGLMTSRLFSKLRERREDASSLLEVSRSVNASIRLAEVLRTITQTAVNITAAKASSIRLLTPDRRVLAESSLDRDVIAGHAVAVLDITRDSRFRYRDEARAEGLVSLYCLPLRRGEETFGVLRVYAGTQHQWSRRERRLLQAFAEQASVAIHNARLHEHLRRSYWETVSALARAIEAKDPHTLGHSERVTDYALQLGRSLDLTAEQLETLRFAATLHDVGKIGLTEASLSRSGHLDMTDEVVLRMHPLIGISILQPVEFLAPALDAVHYHHERWDGKGYPQGLAGEDIPLFARILAVASVYDNLRTAAPGHLGMSAQEAARALKRAAGRELDPELTAVFLQALQSEASGSAAGPHP